LGSLGTRNLGLFVFSVFDNLETTSDYMSSISSNACATWGFYFFVGKRPSR